MVQMVGMQSMLEASMLEASMLEASMLEASMQEASMQEASIVEGRKGKNVVEIIRKGNFQYITVVELHSFL